jgi:GT2 family glycosyltransferase
VVVDEPSGAGPAAARNAGVARTEADVLLFVDADVVVHPDAVGKVAAALAPGSDVDAVFGAYDDAPAAPGVVSQYRNLLHHHVHATSGGAAQTFWAGLGAVRRDNFAAAGGFDEERFPDPAVEDIDLGMRLAADGGRVVLDPEIRGRHLKRWGLGRMIATDFARRGVPWARLALERGVGGTELNLGWRHRIGALASVGIAASLMARRPRLAATSALAMVLVHLPFFSLLARRGGAPLAVAGVPLQAIHHLSGVAAVPVAIAAHLLSVRGEDR